MPCLSAEKAASVTVESVSPSSRSSQILPSLLERTDCLGALALMRTPAEDVHGYFC